MPVKYKGILMIHYKTKRVVRACTFVPYINSPIVLKAALASCNTDVLYVEACCYLLEHVIKIFKRIVTSQNYIV